MCDPICFFIFTTGNDSTSIPAPFPIQFNKTAQLAILILSYEISVVVLRFNLNAYMKSFCYEKKETNTFIDRKSSLYSSYVNNNKNAFKQKNQPHPPSQFQEYRRVSKFSSSS